MTTIGKEGDPGQSDMKVEAAGRQAEYQQPYCKDGSAHPRISMSPTIINGRQSPPFSSCQGLFLRAFCAYRSAPATNNGASPAMIVLDMDVGDVMLILRVHTNGWAYGTSLESGCTGWLPSNYCEVYKDAEIGGLLEAFVGLWQGVVVAATAVGRKQDAGEDETSVAQVQQHQEARKKSARQIVKEVEELLRRTGWLITVVGGVVVQGEAGRHDCSDMYRARRRLLSRLSIFMRVVGRAKGAEEDKHDLHGDVVQEALRKCMHVVVKAIHFLDAWRERGSIDASGVKRQVEEDDIDSPTSVATADSSCIIIAHHQIGSPAAVAEASAAAAETIIYDVHTQPNSPRQCPLLRGITSRDLQASDASMMGESGRFHVVRRDGIDHVDGDGDEDDREEEHNNNKNNNNSNNNKENEQGDYSVLVHHHMPGSVSAPSRAAPAPAPAPVPVPIVPVPVPGPVHEVYRAGAPSPNGTRGSRMSNNNNASDDNNDEMGLLLLPSLSGSAKRAITSHNSSIHSSDYCTIDGMIANIGTTTTTPLDKKTGTTTTTTTTTTTAAKSVAPFLRHVPTTPPFTPSPTFDDQFQIITPAIQIIGPNNNNNMNLHHNHNNNNNHHHHHHTTNHHHNLAFSHVTLHNLDFSTPRHALASIPTTSTVEQTLHLFIASLDSFVASNAMDLLETTHQSFSCCQDLLAVLDAVWERDCKSSSSLSRARHNMQSSLEELSRVTRVIANSSDDMIAAADAADCRNSQDEAWLDIAARCVRSANECLAETREIIDRIGDFDIGPLDLRISGTFTREVAAQAPMTRTRPPRVESMPLFPRPKLLPSAMTESLPSRPSQTSSLPPPSSTLPAPKLRSTRSAIYTTSTSSCTSTDTITLKKKSSFPPPPQSPKSPTINIEIPNTCPGDFFASRRSCSSPPSKRTRARSSMVMSVEGSASTRMSSYRDSEVSMLSQASTRATSPDRSPVVETCTKSLHDSFGPFSDSKLTLLGDDEEEPEVQLLGDTYSHELICNAEGQVRGGSLRALVERLTTYDSTPDAMFLNTFFLTFRYFTTPFDFAQSLVHRFAGVEKNEKASGPVRLRVYNTFRGWLETHWRPESDAEALDTIERFSTGLLHKHHPTLSRRLTALVIGVLDTRQRPGIPRLLSSVNKCNLVDSIDGSNLVIPLPVINRHQLNILQNARHGGPPCSILDFDPLELARQITLAKSKFYCRIRPEELIEQEWRKKSGKSVNVRALTAMTTDLANLVSDTILALEEPKKRAAIIKHWVKVAKHARELGNYDTLKAILMALDNSTIHRLKKTWDHVSPRTMARLDDLKPIMDSSRNWSNLRGIMREHVAPCLPSLGNYLTDLAFIDEGNTIERLCRTQSFPPKASSSPTEKVINFERYLLTARSIGEIQKFQAPFRLAPVVELQEWLMGEFKRVREVERCFGASSVASPSGNAASGRAEDMVAGLGSVEGGFWRRSLKLEPREGCAGGGGGGGGGGAGGSGFAGIAAGMSLSGRGRLEKWSALHLPIGGR